MKLTTKNQVIDILQWTSNEYEDRLFLSIWKWCQLYGGYPSIIQQLLANAEINRWFMYEFAKCENQFLKIAENIPRNNIELLEVSYKACTAQVQQKFNKPLIDKIKRNKEFTNIFLTDTPVYYAN